LLYLKIIVSNPVIPRELVEDIRYTSFEDIISRTGLKPRVQAYYVMKSQDPDEHAFMPEINSMSRALFPMWNERIEDDK
jgi:hypothetical protein